MECHISRIASSPSMKRQSWVILKFAMSITLMNTSLIRSASAHNTSWIIKHWKAGLWRCSNIWPHPRIIGDGPFKVSCIMTWDGSLSPELSKLPWQAQRGFKMPNCSIAGWSIHAAVRLCWNASTRGIQDLKTILPTKGHIVQVFEERGDLYYLAKSARNLVGAKPEPWRWKWAISAADNRYGKGGRQSPQ